MPFRRRWDAVMLLLVAFAIVTLPLRLAFQARDRPYPPRHAHRVTHVLPLRRAFQADIDNQSEVDDGTTVVDVEMGGGERRDSTASIPDLE